MMTTIARRTARQVRVVRRERNAREERRGEEEEEEEDGLFRDIRVLNKCAGTRGSRNAYRG